MKSKTVQFVCVKCNEPVYRLGVKVNFGLKLCGYCSKLKKKGKVVDQDGPVKATKLPSVETFPTNPDKITVDDVFKTPNPSMSIPETGDNTKDIVERINQYHSILSRVIESLLELKPDHDETFLSLWTKAKQDLIS